MKILMPTWFLDILDYSFHLPLMKSISEQLNPQSFHLAYIEGSPRYEWERYFSFHKVDMPCRFIKSKIIRFFLSRRKLYDQVKDVDVDVIFSLSELWMQEFSRYCSHKMGVPYVVRLRGDHREVRKAMKINPVKEWMLNYLETRGLKDASLVIPNARHLAKRAEGWGVSKEKIALPVWNGVDTSMFRPMRVERSSDFTVAYAGRISPEKRVPNLLRVAEKMNDVRFMIAGRKQMEISFPSNVEYLGELPYSEMPSFYNKADVIVLPSMTEGFPNVVLEAYACGKPILATKEALPEELKVFGSVADLEEFESGIKTLKNSDLKNLGQRARSHAEKHYSWDKFGKSIVEHLKNVVG